MGESYLGVGSLGTFAAPLGIWPSELAAEPPNVSFLIMSVLTVGLDQLFLPDSSVFICWGCLLSARNRKQI